MTSQSVPCACDGGQLCDAWSFLFLLFYKSFLVVFLQLFLWHHKVWPVAARGQECGHNGGQLDSYVMLGQIPSLPNNSLPRILFLSIFFFSRFVSSHNRKHIKLCRPMYLCRTRMPILKTVSNVYFKIKMNSEKPGPLCHFNIPVRDVRPALPRPRGKW